MRYHTTFQERKKDKTEEWKLEMANLRNKGKKEQTDTA